MATTLSARKHYRRQVKSSHCRGKTRNSCHNLRRTCKYTKPGKRKSYCRKKKGTKRRSTRAQRAKTNRYEVLGSSSGGSSIALSPTML